MDLRILLATVAIVCVSGTKVWAPKPDDDQKDDVKDFKRESLYRFPLSLPPSPIPDQAHMQIQREQEGNLSFRDLPFPGHMGLARLRLRLRQLPDLRPDRLTPLVSCLACALAQASDEGRKVFPAQIKDVKAFFLQPHELVQVSYREAFLLASSPTLEHPFLVLLKDRITAIEAAEKKLASLPSPVAPAGTTVAGAAAAGAGAGVESGGRESNPSLLKALHALRTYYEDYGTSLCKATSEERRKRLSGIRIQGDHLESYFISEETAYQILSTDVYGLDKRTNKTGASPVACLGGVHFKRNLEKSYGDNAIVSYTLQPGLEWSMYSFSAQLVGRGVPSSMLLRVTGVPHRLARTGTLADTLFKKAGDPNTGEAERQRVEDILSRDPSLQKDLVLETRDYFVQASQTIFGRGLDEVLKTDPSLSQCDPDSFAASFMVTLLTHPTDAKADNFIVSTDERGRQHLASIDNDYTLGHMISRRERDGRHFLEAKSILFCLRGLMTTPLSDRVRKRMLDLTPSVFILEWLKSLQRQNGRYQSLQRQQSQHMGPEAFERLSLPLKFHPARVDKIVQDFIKIQERLRLRGPCTPHDLLSALDPSVALYYETLVKRYHHDPLGMYGHIHFASNHAALERSLDPAYVLPNDKRVEEHLKAEAAPGEAYKDRTQSVEESVLDLFQSCSLDKLGAPVNLHLFLERALDLFPRQVMEVTERTWLDPSLLLRVMPHKPSLSLVEHLLRPNPEQSLKERETYPDTQNTPLHLAVLHDPDLIPFFLERGAERDALNKEGQTPLDLAIVHRSEPAFVHLIAKGAGERISRRHCLSFYKSLKPNTLTHSAFMILMKRNPAVEWEVALETILPPSLNNRNVPLQGTGITLQGAGIGPRTLSEALGKQLLTSQGEMIQRNHLGRHRVGMVEANDKRHKVYFKEYPELPGFEEAVGLLTRQILGFGAPHTELLRIQDRPVLASQGIHGLTLREVLETQPHLFQQLDHEGLASMMLMAMLLNPEDGKPDNYIFEELPFQPGKYRLVGIDNDHAFAPGVAKEQKQKGSKAEVVTQVKTVLFCFDQMYLPIPPQTRQRFLNLDVGNLLNDWLGKLGELNLAYQQLFEDFIKSGKIRDLLEVYNCYVGIPFVPDMMRRLFDKMIVLQEALRSSENLNLTPMDLLRKLEPHLGHRYHTGFKKYRSVKERFQGIDGEFYGSNGQTFTTGGHILNSMNISPKVAVADVMRRDHGYDPNYRFTLAQKELAHNRKQYEAVVLFKVSGGKINSAKPETLTPEVLSKTIEHIDFSTLSPSEEGSLLGALRGQPFRTLCLRKTRTLSNNWARDNLRLADLISLDLRGSQGITHWLLPILRQEAPLLQTLNLSHIEGMSEFSNPGVVYSTLITFDHLISLNLEGCPNLGFIRLIAPHLQWLNASYCLKLLEVTLITPTLRTLQLNNTAATNRMALVLIAQNPQLKQMNLERCSKVEQWIREWGQNLAGNSLNLRGNNTRYTRSRFFANAVKVNGFLREMDLWGNKIEDKGAGHIADVLKVNKSLTHLQLGGNEIRDVGAKYLAEALKVNRGLTWLDLQYDEIGERGAGSLADALKVNQFLRKLNLGSNEIGDTGAGFIAEVFNVNKSLTNLDLRDNGIGVVGAIFIAGALKDNKRLTQLTLRSNQIGDTGAGFIAEALMVNKGLTRLDLGFNQIGERGAGSLGEALKFNKGLTQLDLKQNKIEATGAESLAEALKVNQDLTDLDLGFNQIGVPPLDLFGNEMRVRGAEFLANALKVNRGLTQLNLSYNEIGARGAGFLGEALKDNQVLTQLNLGGNQIGVRGAESLAEALKDNKVLTHLHLWRDDIKKDKFEKIDNFLSQNSERIKEWTASLSEPLGNALLGRAPDLVVLTQRGHQPSSLVPLIPLTQAASLGTVQSQLPGDTFKPETLHLILSYVPSSNLKEWFEQAQKIGPVKETGKDSQKDDEKDDKKDSGKDNKKDDRSGRKLAPFVAFKPEASQQSRPLNPSHKLRLEASDGKLFNEFFVSGEDSGCALYCFGFPDHTSAQSFLLARSADGTTRQLIGPEVHMYIEDRVHDWKAGKFTPRETESQWKEALTFYEANDKAYKDLYAERLKLGKELGLKQIDREGKTTDRAAEADELAACPPGRLAHYHVLKASYEEANAAYLAYTQSQGAVENFIKDSILRGVMMTYTPIDGQTGMMDALSRNLGYNLVIYGKNAAGKLVIVHEFVWDGTKPTKYLLHTQYKDANGMHIGGGIPGTRTNNPWNHFNLLSPDAAMTVETVGLAKPGNSGVPDRGKDKPFPQALAAAGAGAGAAKK